MSSNSPISVAKNYSLTMEHILKVKDIAAVLFDENGKNISEGEVVRRAIDLFYNSPSVKLALQTHPGPAENLVAELRAGLPETE